MTWTTCFSLAMEWADNANFLKVTPQIAIQSFSNSAIRPSTTLLSRSTSSAE